MQLGFDEEFVMVLLDLLDVVEIYALVSEHTGSVAAGLGQLVMLNFQHGDMVHDLVIKLDDQKKLNALD